MALDSSITVVIWKLYPFLRLLLRRRSSRPALRVLAVCGLAVLAVCGVVACFQSIGLKQTGVGTAMQYTAVTRPMLASIAARKAAVPAAAALLPDGWLTSNRGSGHAVSQRSAPLSISPPKATTFITSFGVRPLVPVALTSQALLAMLVVDICNRWPRRRVPGRSWLPNGAM